MAMALSCHPSMSLLQLLLFSLLLLAWAWSQPCQPAMNPVRWLVDRVNKQGHTLGLVMSYIDEATALEASSYFTPCRVLPFVNLYGRRFHIGSIRDVNIIYALTGECRLNAAFTVQILTDVFSVSGSGTAGSSNDSISFGDISVPKLEAFTGAWTWKGVSDLAEGEPKKTLTSSLNLASINNALKVAVEFRVQPNQYKGVTNKEKMTAKLIHYSSKIGLHQ